MTETVKKKFREKEKGKGQKERLQVSSKGMKLAQLSNSRLGQKVGRKSYTKHELPTALSEHQCSILPLAARVHETVIYLSKSQDLPVFF